MALHFAIDQVIQLFNATHRSGSVDHVNDRRSFEVMKEGLVFKPEIIFLISDFYKAFRVSSPSTGHSM